MAVITGSTVSTPIPGGVSLRTYGTSAANSADTLTTAAAGVGSSQKLTSVLVHYSAAPTQAGVSISHINASTPNATTVIAAGIANAQDTVFIPEGGEFWLTSGDQIRVSVPAGGTSITATISINEVRV